MTASSVTKDASRPEAPNPVVRRARWKRSITVGVIGLSLLWIVRAPLLRMVPILLIAGTHETEVDVFIVVDGGGGYREVSRRLDRAPTAMIWLFDRRPNRLQRRGIHVPFLECARFDIAEAEIDAERVQEQPQQIVDTLRLLDHLDQRLQIQPRLRIGLLCDEWNSRRLAGKIRDRISAGHRDRIALIPVADVAVPRTTWWHAKSSRRRVAEAALKLVADWVIVDRNDPPDEVGDAQLRRAAVGSSQ